MSWVCPSCGIENIDDTTRKCIYGHLLDDFGDQKAINVKEPRRFNTFIQSALLLIAILGLTVGAIWFPLSVLLVDIILFFVPIEKTQKAK